MLLLLLLCPMRPPQVRIRTRSLETLAGQRFVVRIDGWQVDSYYPSGKLPTPFLECLLQRLSFLSL